MALKIKPGDYVLFFLDDEIKENNQKIYYHGIYTGTIQWDAYDAEVRVLYTISDFEVGEYGSFRYKDLIKCNNTSLLRLVSEC